MANTTYYHGLIKDIDDNGDIKVLYPKTYASDTEYNNTNSHLTANNVQAAIDEIDADLTASDNTKFEFTKSGDNYGYKDANGAFVPFKRVQASKTVTAGTSAITVIPDIGNDGIASITVNPTPSQSKSVSPSVSAQTITPDSGNLLSSVIVDAISPVIGWEEATITGGGIDSNNKTYVWVPYGYHVNGYNGTNPIWINQDVLQAIHMHSGTFDASSRSSALDMGILHNYRYINTNSVPNSNSGNYSITSNGTKDMGADNTYRYVSTSPYAGYKVISHRGDNGICISFGHSYINGSITQIRYKVDNIADGGAFSQELIDGVTLNGTRSGASLTNVTLVNSKSDINFVVRCAFMMLNSTNVISFSAVLTKIVEANSTVSCSNLSNFFRQYTSDYVIHAFLIVGTTDYTYYS